MRAAEQISLAGPVSHVHVHTHGTGSPSRAAADSHSHNRQAHAEKETDAVAQSRVRACVPARALAPPEKLCMLQSRLDKAEVVEIVVPKMNECI